MTKDQLRVLLGGQSHMTTAAGTISQSVTQTGWAVQTVRYRLTGVLTYLTDLDIVWLLTRGWKP